MAGYVARMGKTNAYRFLVQDLKYVVCWNNTLSMVERGLL